MDGYSYNSSSDKNLSLLLGSPDELVEGYTTTNINIFTNTSVMDNKTETPFIYPTIRQPVHMIVIYSLAYCLVFVLGLVGNILVVSIVYRNPRMHNVTNYFIVNLAIADILVLLLCLPITLLSNLYSGWRFGAIMCKATPFLQGVAVSASVSTLTAISVDRYLAICYTLEFRMSRKMARIFIIVIWSLACILWTPIAIFFKQVDISTEWQNLYVCEQQWPNHNGTAMAYESGFFLGVFLSCYTVPLILISVCYILIALRVWHRDAPGIANTSQAIYRSKVKVLKMLVVVVIVFAFSWLPLYAFNLRRYFGPPLDSSTFEFQFFTQIYLPIVQWLGICNSCVNPIIYCFFSKKFRRGFQEFIHCCKKSQGNAYFLHNSSTLYRTVNDGNGHTMYTSIKNAIPMNDKKLESEDTTCF